jgi:hypothetical protein
MTTAGDLIRGGTAGAPTRVAVGTTGQVLTVAAGVPGWADPAGGVTVGTAGTDASRPAASTGLAGSLYTGTDTATRYLCESDGSGGARWCVVGRHQHEGRDTTCARLGAARSATSDVSIAASTILSGALVFSLGTLPSGGVILLSCAESVSGNGWHIRIGDDATSRGRLASFLTGMGSTTALLTDAVAAADNAIHSLAWTWDGTTVRYSWDGAAVATASHTSGSRSAGTAPVRYGALPSGIFAPNADLAAVKLWSTAVGDADLVAVAAEYASGRLPDVAGATCVFDWHAARYAEGQLVHPCLRGTAQRLTLSAACPMVVR